MCEPYDTLADIKLTVARIKVPACKALCMWVLLLKGASHLAGVMCRLEGPSAVTDAGSHTL